MFFASNTKCIVVYGKKGKKNIFSDAFDKTTFMFEPYHSKFPFSMK